MIDIDSDSKAGEHEDENGKFVVYFATQEFEDEMGWYWIPEMGCPEGPFDTSEAAFASATNLSFAHNHH